MKNWIKKWLGIPDIVSGLEEKIHQVHSSLNFDILRAEDYVDYKNRIADLEGMYTAVVEANHKLKKLEKYLEIEYSVEDVGKPFIGYRKKS